MLYLNEEFKRNWQGADPFKMLQAMEGNIYRQVRGRKTFQFTLNGRSYFAKLHSGVGWSEIIKNLLQLRLPILGAENEWRAITRLQELGIAIVSGPVTRPDGARQVFVNDPDGHLVELCSPPM